jgi:hypothetical protein
MSTWRPIETAPKDGTRILAYGVLGFDSTPSIGTVEYNAFYGRWECRPNEASEYDPEACTVTHWLPLPEPPKEK